MGRVECRKRQGVEVSKKPKEDRRRTRRRLLSCPASFKPVHGAVDPEEDAAFSGLVDLDVGKERETRQDVRQVRVDINANVLRVEKRSAEVKIGEVERAEVGILGDDSV